MGDNESDQDKSKLHKDGDAGAEEPPKSASPDQYKPKLHQDYDAGQRTNLSPRRPNI